MQQLLLSFSRRPWLWIGLLIVASVIAATQLERLQVKISADEMLVADDPQRTFYDTVRREFGDERVVLLVLEDARLLDPAKLVALRQVIDSLERLPSVARSESLFNVPHVKGVDGYLDKQPYLANPPSDDAAAQVLLETAAANPLLRNTLVSDDHQAMAVALVLRDVGDGIDDERLSEAIDAAIAPLKGIYQGAYAIGFAQIRSEISQRIIDEQARLLPLAVAALLFALFLLLRQLLDIMLPLLTAATSILWTFGLMGWLGIPLNVVTSTIPILLIVVGSTEDIHLLAEFRRAQRSGDDVPSALAHMAQKMGRTVVLTFITTSAGFLSVGLSDIEVLRQFGLVASIGLLFNFIITITLIPAALTLAGRHQLDGGKHLFSDQHSYWPARYWRFLAQQRLQVGIILIVGAALVAVGIPRITVNHSPIETLGKDSPVAERIDHLNRHFAGLETFSIIVESGIQDTFLHSRYLNQLVALQRHVQDANAALSATSFGDYLVLLNRAFLESDSAGLPQSNDEIAELMIFLEHQRVQGYVSDDYSRARILVRHAITGAAELNRLLRSVNEYIAKDLDSGLRARITGDSVLSLAASRSMIVGQLQSVLLILTLFVLIVAFIFTDLRIGLLAALPNIFPMIMLFGFMGFAGIPLNIGTTMAAAIAIGIAVDDTLHFMLRYNQELRTSKSQTLAMQNTIREEARPVVATSVALIVGFLVFTQSGFTPVAQFGLLSAVVVGSALLADLIITPLVISSLRLVTLWDLLSTRARQQLMPQSPLFRGMRPWQIRKFVLSSTLLEYQPGEKIFAIGDQSDALYLVMKGVVEITVPRHSDDGREAVVDQFGSGQVFGDVALLAEEPRKTDAVALTHSTLMTLSREAITNVTHYHPFIASRLFLNLARDVSCRWVKFMGRVHGPEEDEDQAR